MSRDTLFWVVMGVIGVGMLLLMLNNNAGQTFGMDNYKFAALVTIGSIGLVYAARLFGQGAALGPMLRRAAAWLCVILALMVVFQLLARNDLLPENFRERPRAVESGTGISASLMDRVNGSLHL